MNEVFERVAEWNHKAGNIVQPVGSDEYFVSLFNQAKRIEEELTELYQAISKRDIKGIVDAGLDLDVVVAGVNYLSGCNYTDAIDAILNNNDLKIFTTEEEAEETAAYYISKGEDVYVNPFSTECETYYTVRRTSDNKILKYENFPQVDLTPFVPVPEIAYYTLAKNSEVVMGDYAKSFPVIVLDSIESDVGKDTLQQVLDQSGHDHVRLVVKAADNEVVRIEAYE